MNFEFELIHAMSLYDLHINQVNLEPGKYHRFRSLGTCKTKCCEYRIFENQLGAHFKCFRRGIDRYWFAKSMQDLQLPDKILIAEERARVTALQNQARVLIATRCDQFFNALPLTPATGLEHPYVIRKQIYPHFAKQARGMLVLPVRDIHYDIWTLQFIMKNGFKKFKPGASATGKMIWLTPVLPQDYTGIIRLCEGWSTGCTIYSVTKSAVICALSAYNLIKVAIEVRRHFINAKIRICADNDQWGAENIGLKCARQAASDTGLPLHYPSFDGLDTQYKPTDYNDLLALAGVDAVRNELKLIKE